MSSEEVESRARRYGRRRIWLLLLLAGAGGAGLGVLSLLERSQLRWLPQCYFYRFTGLLCPGCGTTRALFALAHGDPAGAIANNVILFPALGLSAAMLLFPGRFRQKNLGFVILAVIAAYWILRNLPFSPFIYLAPPENR